MPAKFQVYQNGTPTSHIVFPSTLMGHTSTVKLQVANVGDGWAEETQVKVTREGQPLLEVTVDNMLPQVMEHHVKYPLVLSWWAGEHDLSGVTVTFESFIYKE